MKKYTEPQIEVNVLVVEDVITTSGDPYETPIG